MNLLILLLIVSPLAAAEFSFDAKWKRSMRPDTDGVLSIGKKGISFLPQKDRKRPLTWAFEDVQHLDRTSPTEVSIQSYSDSVVRVGRDRWYRFVLVDGTLSDELYQKVATRIGKPATDRVVSEPPGTELAIPAKHVRLLKGSQGTLYFTPKWIMYSTEAPGESRKWRLDRDVAAVWSSDPYRLEVHVLGGSEAFVRRPSLYRFSLKRPLDSAFYMELKMKLYGLRGAR